MQALEECSDAAVQLIDLIKFQVRSRFLVRMLSGKTIAKCWMAKKDQVKEDYGVDCESFWFQVEQR